MNTRTMAMVHGAMFDAVNAVQPRFQPFKFTGTAPPNASADAASATAAHTVLMKLFPEQRASLDEALAASLAKIPEGQERNNGAAVGMAAAASLLAWCADDRVGLPTQYRPLTQPGKYVMTTLPVGDDFGASRPWLLTRADQFRPGPPPALTSEVWARDINETRKIGAKVRNGDQHGNPAVERDAGWLPLVDAPLHPEYPCAHCISSAAVAKVLQTELGDEVSLTMTSPFLPGVTRKWTRISDYAKEVSNARIWSGVHYRNSAEVDARMGSEIGTYATANYLKPLR